MTATTLGQDDNEIIYDWNRVGFDRSLTDNPVMLLDETLRDGIQSPSVVDPDIADKVRSLVRRTQRERSRTILHPSHSSRSDFPIDSPGT